MALRICVLASGSAANCIYVASDQTRVLIDVGLSGRETERRLAEIGTDTRGIHAVCLTHEHSDHCAALRVLKKRHGLPVYANSDTAKAVDRMESEMAGVEWNIFTTGVGFTVGDLHIEPFSVPHDAYDPVGFLVTCGHLRAGIVTDMGMVTTLIRERLRNCQAVVIETNHDPDMLSNAKRPWSLKQRIKGRQGHLSNQEAADLVVEIAGPHLKSVFVAHLSRECNHPDLAHKTVREALDKGGFQHVSVLLTYADRVSEMVTIE
jgi:phosphoribosyl 1,2-cyclic phosphodiesterase